MLRLKIDNNVFYRELNVSKERIRYKDGWREGTFNQDNLIKDIEQEIEENPATNNVPKYQTNANLYTRMRGRKHWDDLFRKVCHSLMRIYTKPYVLVKSWANIARSNSNYGFHTHKQDNPFHLDFCSFGSLQVKSHKIPLSGIQQSLLTEFICFNELI